MKSFLIVACFVLAVLTCSDVNAQCEGGSCSLPGRVIVRSSNIVRTVAVRPFRRGWLFGRRSGRG